jgi:phosphate transport system ATP-binding protein
MLDGDNILDRRIDVSDPRQVGMVFRSRRRFHVDLRNIAFGVRLFEMLPRVEMDERVSGR